MLGPGLLDEAAGARADWHGFGVTGIVGVVDDLVDLCQPELAELGAWRGNVSVECAGRDGRTVDQSGLD